MQAIITSQRCVRIIQVGMVLFLLFFAHYVGISRRSTASASPWLWFFCRDRTRPDLFMGWSTLWRPTVMSILNMACYNGSLLVWLGYVVVKSPARDASLSLLQPQRWSRASPIFTTRFPPTPHPMFEGMVDRALSRTHPTCLRLRRLSPMVEPRAAQPLQAADSAFSSACELQAVAAFTQFVPFSRVSLFSALRFSRLCSENVTACARNPSD